MALARRFEELEIWQEARKLHRLVWEETRASKDFEFRSQIRRAALSIMNNIAEGFERRTDKDFAHFLDLAKSSCGELRSMAYAGEDVGGFYRRLGPRVARPGGTSFQTNRGVCPPPSPIKTFPHSHLCTFGR